MLFSPSDSSLTEEQRWYYQVVGSLHRWYLPKKERWSPHPSQLLVGEALFSHDIKFVFVQCGRKWGKTEIIIYCLWRFALLNPGSACYYICPQEKQAKEIVWKSKDRRGKSRIQQFGPAEFVESIDNTELRVNFINGSFIKVDGSDNYDSWAGISPNFLVLDEFRSFKPQFYTVMNPNRAVYDAPLIIIGTPPEQIWIDKDTPHQYVELAKEAQLDMNADGSALWLKRPSWDNPDPMIHKFLKKEKKRLIRRNREYEWWREYGAELVPGTALKVFPAFVSDPTEAGAHVIAHGNLLNMMQENYAHGCILQ